MKDLGRLRAFLSVVDEGGFTAAARALNVAQPWLSVQVKQLEEELGVRLLSRSRRLAVELTVAGNKFVPLARQTLATFNNMIVQTRQLAAEDNSVLRVGSNPFTLYMPIRNRLMDSFRSISPSVRIDITSDTSDNLVKDLLQYKLDVIISAGEMPKSINSIRLCGCRMAVLVPIESEFADESVLSVSDLAGKSVLTVAKELRAPMLLKIDNYMKKAGVSIEHSPETSYEATVRLAQVTRRIVVTADLQPISDDVPKTMKFKRVVPASPVSWWRVGHLKEVQNRSVKLFMSLARQQAAASSV